MFNKTSAFILTVFIIIIIIIIIIYYYYLLLFIINVSISTLFLRDCLINLIADWFSRVKA